MLKPFLGLVFGVFFSFVALAASSSQTVLYKEGATELEGFVALPSAPGRRPAVLIFHDWMGNGDFTRTQAQKLADLGYVAFAADVYGKGVRPADQKQASELAGKYKSDRKLMRARARAALDTLRANAAVDPARVIATGFCFGGTVALELARSGAPLAGVSSFHGGLDTPQASDARNIKGKVLVMHGADDPFVPAKDVAAFEKEMKDAKLDWQLISYGGAVHAFTNPKAGNDPSKGQAYNPLAAARAWEHFQIFLKEVVAGK